MMMAVWEKIAYTVQLAAACLIFMAHARKRESFILRVIIGCVMLLLVSFGINSILENHIMGIWSYAYWAAYILGCVFFVGICLEVSWTEAVYCAFCACAMQHVAYDMVLIYQLLGGGNNVMLMALYSGIYLLFYLLFISVLCIIFLFNRFVLTHHQKRDSLSVHAHVLIPAAVPVTGTALTEATGLVVSTVLTKAAGSVIPTVLTEAAEPVVSTALTVIAGPVARIVLAKSAA